MRLWLLSVLVTCLTVDGTYMPGSPGGAWTREEILTVKAKLRYPQLLYDLMLLSIKAHIRLLEQESIVQPRPHQSWSR